MSDRSCCARLKRLGIVVTFPVWAPVALAALLLYTILCVWALVGAFNFVRTGEFYDGVLKQHFEEGPGS